MRRAALESLKKMGFLANGAGSKAEASEERENRIPVSHRTAG